MPNDRGVVRGHTPTIGNDRVEADRASLTSSCPLPRHATFVLCVPGVRAASTFDSRARHPRLTSHCRCRGSVLRAHLESLMTLKLVRMPARRGTWGCVTLGQRPTNASASKLTLQSERKTARTSPACRL